MKKLYLRNDSRKSLMIILACLLACLLGMSALAETTTAATVQQVDPSPAAYVSQKNASSVVGILTYADEWLRSSGQTQSVNVAQGSGVVIREGGFVLTNHHVIEGGTSFKVLMPSGDKVEATLVGSDSSLDLAVLKVEGEEAAQLVPVEVGATTDLMVGSTVVAIGNPGGEVLANTVTQGIVSALERSTVNAQNATRAVAYIQHDAAINNGNSGGGLFDYRGRLVGINTLKYSGSAYSAISFEGLGFAIPVETAVKVSSDLIEFGKVIRPALGVQVAAYYGPDEPLASYPPKSVCIYALNEGGAAERAGLQQYDFIYAINGQRVTTMLELTAQLDQHKPGDAIEVTVIRYGEASQRMQQNTRSFYGFGMNPYGESEEETPSVQTGEVTVSGGYEEVTVSVTLEELE